MLRQQFKFVIAISTRDTPCPVFNSTNYSKYRTYSFKQIGHTNIDRRYLFLALPCTFPNRLPNFHQRSAINGNEGYVYTIVFEDTETNVGDQPMLTPSDTFTGTASIRVRRPFYYS